MVWHLYIPIWVGNHQKIKNIIVSTHLINIKLASPSWFYYSSSKTSLNAPSRAHAITLSTNKNYVVNLVIQLHNHDFIVLHKETSLHPHMSGEAPKKNIIMSTRKNYVVWYQTCVCKGMGNLTNIVLLTTECY